MDRGRNALSAAGNAAASAASAVGRTAGNAASSTAAVIDGCATSITGKVAGLSVRCSMPRASTINKDRIAFPDEDFEAQLKADNLPASQAWQSSLSGEISVPHDQYFTHVELPWSRDASVTELLGQKPLLVTFEGSGKDVGASFPGLDISRRYGQILSYVGVGAGTKLASTHDYGKGQTFNILHKAFCQAIEAIESGDGQITGIDVIGYSRGGVTAQFFAVMLSNWIDSNASHPKLNIYVDLRDPVHPEYKERIASKIPELINPSRVTMQVQISRDNMNDTNMKCMPVTLPIFDSEKNRSVVRSIIYVGGGHTTGADIKGARIYHPSLYLLKHEQMAWAVTYSKQDGSLPDGRNTEVKSTLINMPTEEDIQNRRSWLSPKDQKYAECITSFTLHDTHVPSLRLNPVPRPAWEG